MKLLCVLLAVLSWAGAAPQPAASARFTQTLEAENMHLTGRAVRLRCDECSGGYTASYLGEGGAITWATEVPRAGVYRLSFRNRTGNQLFPGLLTIDGIPLIAVKFHNTHNLWETLSLKVPLRQGINTLSLSNERDVINDVEEVSVSDDLTQMTQLQETVPVLRPAFVLTPLENIPWNVMVIVLGSLCLSISMLIKIMRGKRKPGYTVTLVWSLLGISLIFAGYAVEILDVTFIGTYIGFTVKLLGLLIGSWASLFFVWHYTGSQNLQSRGLRTVIIMIISTSALLIVTDPWTGWAQIRPHLSTRAAFLPFSRIEFTFPMKFCFIVTNLLLFFGSASLFAFRDHVSRIYRSQINIISLSLILPPLPLFIFPTILYQFGFAEQDPSVFGASLLTLMLALALYRYHLLDLSPTAWGKGFALREEGELVIGPQQQLIEANPVARRLFGNMRVGQPVRAIHPLDDLSDLLHWQNRFYRVQRTTIGSKQSPLAHRIALSDVTDLKLAEADLRRSNDQLTLLQSELREQAIRDKLTGLYNRRFMEEILTKEVRRTQKESGDLSVILLDIDNFREFNARCGYSGGDTVLHEVGKLLLATQGMACRYGGEEFLLILPGLNLDAALLIAETVQDQLSQLHVEHAGQQLVITASASVASLALHGAAGLLLGADEALLLAKRRGRNRIEVGRARQGEWGRGWS
ncbi:diguanylate cyclase [Deinococcus sp.]|uniref:diguanylate cyclase n=1 Tax=Deinococcus sp. TaxID=47478 RepID=UPI0025F79484|nr:diguanylate cyclase [Deinococcus sp.]